MAMKEGSLHTKMEDERSKNWALDDLVTPINYASLDPSLRLLVMSENKSPIV